ncbi:MAG: YbjP/YqhG family protein [Acidobacteriota bacterium]|nr:YbjP/YqhG family protein [Acidobacteriota bacterium]
MKILILVLSIGIFFTFAGNSALAQTAQTPDAVIKELYRVHNQQINDIEAGKSHVLEIVNSRVLLNKFFDKNLAGLIWKDSTEHKNDIGVIDSDIFYDTQDPMIKNLSIGQAKIEGAKATVPVSFTNDGRKYKVTYLMVKQNGAWKIADIKYSGGNTLLKYFKEGV